MIFRPRAVSFSSDLVRGVHARASVERRSRETRETREAAPSLVSRLQSRAWSFACRGRFARRTKKRERLLVVWVSLLVGDLWVGAYSFVTMNQPRDAFLIFLPHLFQTWLSLSLSPRGPSRRGPWERGWSTFGITRARTPLLNIDNIDLRITQNLSNCLK